MKKTTVLVPIMAFALTTGAALRSHAAAIADDKVYAVEVVNVDVPNRVLRIRSTEGGVSSLVFDDRVLSGLRVVRPGDKITISVRDEFTGQRKVVTAFVAGTITTAGKRSAMRTVIMKQPGTAVEFVNMDPTARKITVLGEYGEQQIFEVDEKAMLSMADVRPGQKVFLSYRYDINGRPEAVVRVAPSSTPMIQTGASVDVISTDPLEKTLTIRSDSGERRTLAVDERAALNLRDLRVGDSILVKMEGDRVVVITRR